MYLHNGCNELVYKVVLDEAGPVVVEEVNDQTLDVRAVLVLVGHDEQLAVAQAAQVSTIRVLLVVVQPQDLHDVGNLFVVHQLK